MKSLPEFCPVVTHFDGLIKRDNKWIARAATLVEDMETADIDARLRYAAAEESVLNETLSPLLNPGQWIQIHGMLADSAEKYSANAQAKADEDTHFYGEALVRDTANKQLIIDRCNVINCALASLKRATHLDAFACGSKDRHAQYVSKKLSDRNN